MDLLTDLLRSLAFENALVFRAELGAPWGVRLSGEKASAFHFLQRGRARLELAGQAPLGLSAGDLVVLPRGEAHVVRDHRRSRVVDFDLPTGPHGVFHEVRLGGGGEVTSTLSACFHLAGAQLGTFLSALPPVVHLRGDAARVVPSLDAVLQSLAQEAARARPGLSAIVSRLSEVVFIHAVRHWLETAHVSTGWAAIPKASVAARPMRARP